MRNKKDNIQFIICWAKPLLATIVETYTQTSKQITNNNPIPSELYTYIQIWCEVRFVNSISEPILLHFQNGRCMLARIVRIKSADSGFISTIAYMVISYCSIVLCLLFCLSFSISSRVFHIGMPVDTKHT